VARKGDLVRIGTFRGVVNASILFTELPLYDRFRAVHTLGFDAVELWWPFATPTATDAQIGRLVESIDRAGLELVSLNLYAGDMAGGQRGVISWPDRVGDVVDNVASVTRIAKLTGCRLFNALYGQRRADVPAEMADRAAERGYRIAAETVGEFGGTLLIEPLTAGENGAYPLLTAADTVATIDRIRQRAGVDNVRLLLDTYHLTNNGDDLTAVIDRFGPAIGHLQVADAPGRAQPGTGSIDFGRVFGSLADIGYAGFASCEYVSVGPSAESFDWIAEIGER
jgi:hydroxypyruvate isomerase